MAVEVEPRGRLLVPEHLLNDLHVGAGRESRHPPQRTPTMTKRDPFKLPPTDTPTPTPPRKATVPGVPYARGKAHRTWSAVSLGT